MSFVQQPELKWVESATFASGSAYSVPRGGPTLPGDFLLIIGANSDPAAAAQWQAKAGWTLLHNIDGDEAAVSADVTVAMYYKYADGAEGGSEAVTYAIDGGGAWLAYLNLGQRVLATGTPIQIATTISAIDAADPQTTIAAPSVVVDQEKALGILVAAFGGSGHTGFTIADDAWSSVVDVQAGSGVTATAGLVALRSTTHKSFEGETLAEVNVTSDGTPQRGWLALTLYARPNCGRTTAQVLDELLKFLPPEYVEATDLLGGIAAQIAQQEADGCTLFDLGTIARGVGKWLTLHGQGLGFLRGPGEGDAAYRERMRTVEDRVTRPAILSTVTSILETHGSGGHPTPVMIEWFESPNLNMSPFFLNTAGAALSGGALSFVIILPDLGDDDLFNDTVYDAISNALNEIRAAGVRVYVVLAPAAVNAIPNRANVLGSPQLQVTGDITSQDRAGFDTFSAANYAVVDYGRLATNNVRMWAVKFSLAAAPATDQVLLGSAGADGVALWLTVAGDIELRIEDGTTTVSETLATAVSIEVGPEWWVFLQADIRTTAGGSIAGIVGVGKVGDANLLASATFQPTAGVDMDVFVAEQRVGTNAGTITGSPNTSGDGIVIHEVREYDSAAEAFVFDTATLDAIVSESNNRVDRIDLKYDGSDDVFV